MISSNKKSQDLEEMLTTTKMRAFLRDRSGATMIEYAFIAVFIALALILSLAAIGIAIEPIFEDATKAL